MLKNLLLSCLLGLASAGCTEMFLPPFNCSGDECTRCDFIEPKLLAISAEYEAGTCHRCQGAACGGDAGTECEDLPCVDGGFVVRACNIDEDCASLDAVCAHYAASPDHTCVDLDYM